MPLFQANRCALRYAIIFLVLISHQALALSKLDSLEIALNSASNDSVRIAALINLADFYFEYNYELCVQYGERALALSVQTGANWGRGRAHLMLGNVHWSHSYYDRC